MEKAAFIIHPVYDGNNKQEKQQYAHEEEEK